MGTLSQADCGMLREQVRDNAIVFSIEHVRLIITADSVIVPRDGYENKPSNALFLESLEESILEGVQVLLPGQRTRIYTSESLCTQILQPAVLKPQARKAAVCKRSAALEAGPDTICNSVLSKKGATTSRVLVCRRRHSAWRPCSAACCPSSTRTTSSLRTPQVCCHACACSGGCAVAAKHALHPLL